MVKCLVYLLRFITPFVSRSVATLLNISSETGFMVSPSDVYLDLWFLLFGPLTGAVDVDGIAGVVCNLGTNTGGVMN